MQRREKAWLTVFKVDEAQNLLSAASQKPEDDLLEILRANWYQNCAGLMTVASSASEKLGAVSF